MNFRWQAIWWYALFTDVITILWERCKFYRFRIQDVYTSTRSYTSRVHGRVPAVNRADGLYVPCTPVTRPCTGRKLGRVHMTVYRPCTRVHGRTYTARVHGLVCIRPVYTCTDREHRPWTLEHDRVHGLKTACTRPCIGRVYGCVHGPCAGVHGPYTTSRAVRGPCTGCVDGRVRCLYAKQQLNK